MKTSTDRRVCVIGAGLAGLATAKVLQADGFDVTIFEKAPRVGGVWLPSRTYPELRTNTAREEYTFSDFPFPESADDFPTAEQVLGYIESYVDHFELQDSIQLSTKVTAVSPAERNGNEAHPGFQVKEMVEGKRVIVVGAGKSAVDCAAVAAQHARSRHFRNGLSPSCTVP